MIKFSDIDGQLLSRLDANGTDAYDLNLDRIMWVNGAQYLIQSAISSLLERKKFSGESLRDLNFTACFQTSHFGQVDVDTLLGGVTMQTSTSQPLVAHKLWTVIAVYPEFVATDSIQIQPDPMPERSRLRQSVRFVSPLKAAKHSTQEQWAQVHNDPFSPGNTTLTSSMKEYSYLFGSRPVNTGGPPSFLPLIVLPHEAGQRQVIAISYLKVPYKVPEMPLSEQDPLYQQVLMEWPESMSELLLAVSLRFCAYKQGDNTNIYALTSQEMSMLLSITA